MSAGADPLPFTHGEYTLYTAEVEAPAGVRRRLWFFAKKRPRSAVPAAKPAGFHVAVDPRGAPFLRGPAAGHKAS
jgi:hypothetical protein